MKEIIILNKSDYENAYIMVSECEVFANRAWLLYINKDFSGSLEAIQHLIEWALKALFVLFGRYSKQIWTHDPMKHWPILENMLELVYDLLQFPKIRERTLEKLKQISEKASEYHDKTIYGSYSKFVHAGEHIPASKMITQKEVEQFLFERGFVLEFTKVTILVFGHIVRFNSVERDKELKEKLKHVSPKLKPESYDELKRIVKTQ